ncbi:MAG TPA: flavin reductase family protein [Thermoanaerobaculia bacterium]|jgi:flavin reductase (DIM6/NTAB) family NADH-FMN oxidoreductase RutF|nr:flavin reductase family protein [Thermoanaerobaculia bacterium]
MPIDDARFKEALSHFASGVTVVTTEHEEKPYGMTVASFASLSLHPPLVLVCVAKAVKTHAALLASGVFGVSILSSTQADLSNRFASKIDDKFEGVSVRRGSHGIPLLEGAICTLECKVHEQFASGDHTIFVGEVLDAQVGEGKPLAYYRSGYREIT